MARGSGLVPAVLLALALASAAAYARRPAHALSLTRSDAAAPISEGLSAKHAALNASTSNGVGAWEPLPRLAEPSPFDALPALRITSLNTRTERRIKLYDSNGVIDEAAAKELDELLCDARKADEVECTQIDRRTLQLLYRAAYHFRVDRVEVVSGYRKPGRRREGPHGEGRAIDFKLPGVLANKLASYLRTLPRVGVGIYTHPKTQYVHLDSREQSFHWLDSSPPGKRYRERSIGSRAIFKRDATYRRADDWPEGTQPPTSAT